MAKADLTAQRLRELLSYEPETGHFRHLLRRSGVTLGALAGCVATNGYAYISIDGRKYCAHRLAFLHMTGEWPIEDVDHINCDPTDNRWANIRSVSRKVNNQNRRRTRSDNTSGFMGVSRCMDGDKWRARVMLNQREVHLGRFDTREAAQAAYLKAKRQLHEGCTI